MCLLRPFHPFHPFQGMYFELMLSPNEARSLYQKELDRDPNNPLMLKRMVSIASAGC